VNIANLYQFLSEKIPASLSCDWDRDGLAVCPNPHAEVTGVLTVLDVTEEALDLAKSKGLNVILAHHPLLFRPLSSLTGATPTERLAMRCLLEGVSVMSFHTRADAVEGGTNTCLLSALKLSPIELEGEGLLYRMGKLEQPLSAKEFALYISRCLGATALRYADGGKPISTVLVCGGGGREFAPLAGKLSADAYVSGELGHHVLCDAPALGVSYFEAGHYETEIPLLAFFEALLQEADPTLRVERSTITPLCSL